MTQSYDQIRTRWAVAEPFIGAATKGHTPIFDGQVHRAIIAHLLENGSATDHEIYPACKTTLLYTRKTLKEMLAAGLVQYADPSKKQRKPYGLTREGIRLALSQEIN